MSKIFKIQVPQSIVRNKDISPRAFVLLIKLIQAYYQQRDGKTLSLMINHKVIKESACLTNVKLLESLQELFCHGIIKEEIEKLPSKGALQVTLSEKVIPELNKDQFFVQLEWFITHKLIIETIKHTGIKLLYYFMSYINYNEIWKDKCFASMRVISRDLGISEKTLSRHITLLEKNKFIKVKRHDPKPVDTLNKLGQEKLLFDRFPNEYKINHDQFKKYIDKHNSLLAKEED